MRAARAVAASAVAMVAIAVLASTAPAQRAGPTSLPRLLVSDDSHTFRVRPRQMSLIEADGGTLTLRWSKWTAASAAGGGTSQTDHVRVPARILVWRPVGGYFTRIRMTFKFQGRWRKAPTMLLARDTSLGGLVWVPPSLVNNPDYTYVAWHP